MGGERQDADEAAQGAAQPEEGGVPCLIRRQHHDRPDNGGLTIAEDLHERGIGIGIRTSPAPWPAAITPPAKPGNRPRHLRPPAACNPTRKPQATAAWSSSKPWPTAGAPVPPPTERSSGPRSPYPPPPSTCPPTRRESPSRPTGAANTCPLTCNTRHDGPSGPPSHAPRSTCPRPALWSNGTALRTRSTLDGVRRRRDPRRTPSPSPWVTAGRRPTYQPKSWKQRLGRCLTRGGNAAWRRQECPTRIFLR